MDGVLLIDGVIEGAVEGGTQVLLMTSTSDRLTRPMGTMLILLYTDMTDILRTGTTADTRIEPIRDRKRTQAASRPLRLVSV